MLKSRLKSVVTEKRAKVTQKLTKIYEDKKGLLVILLSSSWERSLLYLRMADRLKLKRNVHQVARQALVHGWRDKCGEHWLHLRSLSTLHALVIHPQVSLVRRSPTLDLPVRDLFLFVSLIVVTRFVHRKKRWHYFLFDFCYFVNLLVILFIHVLPGSVKSFSTVNPFFYLTRLCELQEIIISLPSVGVSPTVLLLGR